jgi:putative phage-type endonuclease
MIMTNEREDWLRWRSTGIGASDIAGILGVSPWASPYSVWAQKSMNVRDDNPPNAEAMRWGTLLEGAILDETARRLAIKPHSTQLRCTHRQFPWAICTVDALFSDDEGDDGVIEIKTSPDAKWYEVPNYYQAQVQWQLEVTDRQRAWVACLHNGRRLSLWRIERDKETAWKMLDIAEQFWSQYVETGRAPEVDASAATSDALSLRYAAAADGGEPVAIDSIAGIVTQLRQARDKVKAAEEQQRKAENEIKAAMGESVAATVAGAVVVTWKMSESRRIDLDLLRDLYPNEADDCTVTKQTRRFLLRKAAS